MPHVVTETASDLVICRLSKNSGSVRGGEEVFLLCEKVHKGQSDIPTRVTTMYR